MIRRKLKADITYFNTLQKAIINTISIRRIVIDVESKVIQIIYCIGNTDIFGTYKQLKCKPIVLDLEKESLNVFELDPTTLQDRVMNWVENKIIEVNNGTATINQR